ncbi:hypothetical protein [Pontixanthobacter sp.]|uniref:hypothetical protein n=1 Tax=Pontixanthobacter sp. TaxID=2792078 RepID=UPI003C7AF60A
MRPLVVVAILLLGLLAAIMLRQEKEADFGDRFDNAQKHIRDLAEDIDNDIADQTSDGGGG